MKRFFLALIAFSMLGLSAVVSAANEVKLLKVESIVDGRYGANAQAVRFDVNVANLGYQKQVIAHMKKDDGAWIDVPLKYSRQAESGREIWVGTYWHLNSTGTGGLPTFDPEFAIKYSVNGQTYWDNNGGANYRIGRNDGTILYGKLVYNGNYQPTHYRTSLYQGWVTVKNLSYAKQVKVVYSTDNWVTKKTVDGTFSSYFWVFCPDGRRSGAPNPETTGFEEWNFILDVGNASQVVYAIQYTVNGQTYWDNNYGRDYRVTFQ